MSDEKLTPMAGDVWERDGHVRLVYKLPDFELWLFDEFGWPSKFANQSEWFDGATLLVRDGKPYQPPPSGDVITVECAVMTTKNGELFVDGVRGSTAVETWEERSDTDEHRGYQHVATVSVNVPRSLLKPQSLPPVTAVRNP